MNRFIKKNMFLVGVLGISALGVLVLLVLSIWQYIVMSAYIRNTEDMKSDIDKLQRQKPPADERNIPLVQEDIAGYDKAMVRLKNYFGHPLYPALQKFAAKLNLTPEQTGIIVALALGINPILDMFETACNVAGDNIGTYVIGKRLKMINK